MRSTQGIYDTEDFSVVDGYYFVDQDDGAGIGDFNGDGFADFIVGPYVAPINSALYERQQVETDIIAHIVFGANNIATGVNGVRDGTAVGIIGAAEDAPGGSLTLRIDSAAIRADWVKVEALSDVNGDNLDDFYIQYDGGHAIVYGQTGDANINLDQLEANQGFQFEATDTNFSLEVFGDVDGDGLNEFLVKETTRVDNEYSTDSYLLYGHSLDLTLAFDPESLPDTAYTQFEKTRQDAIGDINGDGFDDIALTFEDETSDAAIIFGNEDGFSNKFNLADITLDGSQGFELNNVPFSISYSDRDNRIITTDNVDADGNKYIFTASVISSVGDLNGDGIDDLLISDPGGGRIGSSYYGDDENGAEGLVYVLFGSSDFASEIELNTSYFDGETGFAVRGSFPLYMSDSRGSSPSNFGSVSVGGMDVNGDGIDDLLLGDNSARGNNSVLILGRDDESFDAFYEFDEISEGLGLVFEGKGSIIEEQTGALLGASVDFLGDVNGDGYGDFLFSADGGREDWGPTYYGQEFASGGSYIFFGRENIQSLTPTLIYYLTSSAEAFEVQPDEFTTVYGLAGDDRIYGLESDDTLFGGVGDDYLVGRGGDDILIGGDGDDVLHGRDGDDVFYGGAGNDHFSGGDGEDNLIFENGEWTGIEGAEFTFTQAIQVSLTDKTVTTEAGISTYSGIEKISGTEFDDVFYGSSDNTEMKVYGRAGNDTLKGAEGHNILYGDEGNDAVSGGQGNDFLFGGEGDDRLFGEDGADRLFGDEGDDYIVGNAGDDWLYGGLGQDILSGREGDDALYGEDGADLLQGGDGGDLLSGGSGNDELHGGEGEDSLYGGNGHDTLHGDEGDDYLFGQGGHDILYGGGGDDVLSGGYDFIELSSSSKYEDILTGGAGNDVFEFQTDWGQDIITDFELGDKIDLSRRIAVGEEESISDAFEKLTITAEGDDVRIRIPGDEFNSILLRNVSTSEITEDSFIFYIPEESHQTWQLRLYIDHDLSSSSQSFVIQGSVVDDYLSVNLSGDDVLFGNAGNDFLSGGFNNDELHGGEGNDTLYGEEGDDTLYGGVGDDTLNGDEGEDTLYGGEGNDTLYGDAPHDLSGRSNDIIYGGAGEDTLWGRAGNDILHGNEGDDTLAGGHDNDELNGGEGNDRLFGEGGDDTLYGGAGDDYLVGNDGNDLLIGGDGNDNLQGREGDDRVFGEAGNDELRGFEGNDYLVGNEGDDLIAGYSGNDNLQGREGNDRIFGGLGDDYMKGGTGDDYLVGEAGNDALYGEDGNDSMHGRDGDDRLNGGGGNDYMKGGDGNDILDGGDKFDSLYGEAGVDTFVFAGNWRHDKVQDWEEGETLDMSSQGIDFSNLTVAQSGDDTVINITGDSYNSITLIGIDADTIDAGDFYFG
ncbi:calcium-binding protein [Hirschia litorea]|uniref:Ca2+-binding protein, RTX toxin-related n=1 Tax=Hirschia litorea TaxID=1199156 RepID=A0ABW2IMR1_9PROT